MDAIDSRLEWTGRTESPGHDPRRWNTSPTKTSKRNHGQNRHWPAKCCVSAGALGPSGQLHACANKWFLDARGSPHCSIFPRRQYGTTEVEKRGNSHQHSKSSIPTWGWRFYRRRETGCILRERSRQKKFLVVTRILPCFPTFVVKEHVQSRHGRGLWLFARSAATARGVNRKRSWRERRCSRNHATVVD